MKIKLFGVLKTMIPGGRDLEMELSEERRVKDLVYSIQVAYPQVGELLEQKRYWSR